MMKIRCARPIKGRRKPLCTTDEAKVSRVFTKDRVLVERLQHLPEFTGSSPTVFNLQLSEIYIDHFSPKYPTYHLMKALALETAHSLFPENFLHLHEIRFFSEADQRYSVAYSDFIPDETGVIARRRKIMKRYYRARDKTARLSIKEKFDREERSITPDLVPAVKRAQAAGIAVPHPEANYHLSGGKIVFFEVDTIDLPAAVSFSRLAADDSALGLLAMMYASYVRVLAYRAIQNPAVIQERKELCHSYESQSLSSLKTVFHSIFLDRIESDSMMQEKYNVVKNHFDGWSGLAAAIREYFGVSEESLALDARTSEEMDRILRHQF